MEIILENIFGGGGEDDDMTAGASDMIYTTNKLIKLAKEKNLEAPFKFIIQPKKWIITSYPYSMWKTSQMWLVDKNNKVIKTNNLVWK